MSGTATLAVVLLAFFVAGIGAGVAVVIALSARRTREQPGPDWPASEDDDQEGDWTREDAKTSCPQFVSCPL